VVKIEWNSLHLFF